MPVVKDLLILYLKPPILISGFIYISYLLCNILALFYQLLWS